MEDITSFVAGILGQSESDTSVVVEHIRNLGADTLDDIRFLDAETELVDVLPLLKRRRLSAGIRAKFTNSGNIGCICGKNFTALLLFCHSVSCKFSCY